MQTEVGTNSFLISPCFPLLKAAWQVTRSVNIVKIMMSSTHKIHLAQMTQ